MVLIARDIVLIDVIDAPVVRMIREFVHGEQETQVGVVLLGGCHTLDLLEDLDDSVDGGRVIGGRRGGGGGDGRLALDAQQLDELCPEDGEGEALGVERGQRGQRLDELDRVLPLAVQDELPQEEKVVAVASVDHARFPLQCHLRREHACNVHIFIQVQKRSVGKGPYGREDPNYIHRVSDIRSTVLS